MDVWLLPGMDGTGALFAPLDEALRARGCVPRVHAYPGEVALGYGALLERLPPPSRPCVLVAESFSGPLGIELSARHPEHVRALVLVASFARDPTRVAARLGAWLGPVLFRAQPPRLALRLGLAGLDAPAPLLDALTATLPQVAPHVWAQRLRALAEVDARPALARVSARLVYLAGSRDRLVRPRVVAELRRQRPDLELHTLDAPHLVVQRQPEAAADLIAGLVS